jgi:2-dehydropantoate 2-reductase
MIKILVAGIGGVGGYFGGLLARAYEQSRDVQIHFLARGEHLHEILKNGLTVLDDDVTFVTRPKHATDKSGELGKMDYIILCTKSYDLLPLLEQLRACTDDQTVILPLMNGVDSKELMAKYFPLNVLADGCAHINSRYVAPGHIAKTGSTAKLSFGVPHTENTRLKSLENILLQAGIDATCTTDIALIVWEKFIFISALATATSFFDSPVGAIVEDPDKRGDMYCLLGEATALAVKMNPAIPAGLPDTLLKRIEAIPYQATTSMHSDYMAKKGKTELESLTGYVVREGEKQNVPTPRFAAMYNALRIR